MAIYSKSTIQNINNRCLRIWKNKCIIKLINNQPDIETIYLYAKDPYEAKYQFSINKRDSTGLKHFNDPKAFIEYSNNMQDFKKYAKLNISLVFIAHSYFKVPKDVRLNSTHFFIMKIQNKRELQKIALNHSSDIKYKDFIKIYEKCTSELITHASHNL